MTARSGTTRQHRLSGEGERLRVDELEAVDYSSEEILACDKAQSCHRDSTPRARLRDPSIVQTRENPLHCRVAKGFDTTKAPNVVEHSLLLWRNKIGAQQKEYGKLLPSA